MSIKWSSFTNAGELTVGSQVVGLTSGGANARFDFPGTGIKDANDNYLLRYSSAVGSPVNYLTISNSISGSPVTLSSAGSDSNIDLQLIAKGTGSIVLLSGLAGNVSINSTAAIKMPAGTTAERPVGVAGEMRYNTSLSSFEFYDTGLATWSQFISGSSVSSVTGTAGRITSTGGSTPQIDIDGAYVGQTSITTLGNIATGTWLANTIAVNHGGTGNSSTTAYSVICGGTTSTGALQSVASIGTSNQVLTSNGAGALPTWQSLAISQTLQGRLTLSTGVPVTTTDVTAATTVYFTPYKGNYVSLYISGIWTLYSFTEKSVAVPATTNQMYDLFIYNNSGTIGLSLIVWTNDTTRATALTTVNGVYVSSSDNSYRYIGSFRTTAVSGQTEDSKAKRFLWNYYNRTLRSMQYFATGSNWTYSSSTIRQANASTASQLSFVIGISEDNITALLHVASSVGTNNNPGFVAIGLNSTTAVATNCMYCEVNLTPQNALFKLIASFTGFANAGYNYLSWLECSPSNTAVLTFYGSTVGTAGLGNQSGLLGSLLG